MEVVYAVIGIWFLLSSVGLRQEYEKNVKLHKQVKTLEAQLQKSSLAK